jgi:hypothetical protein
VVMSIVVTAASDGSRSSDVIQSNDVSRMMSVEVVMSVEEMAVRVGISRSDGSRSSGVG